MARTDKLFETLWWLVVFAIIIGCFVASVMVGLERQEGVEQARRDSNCAHYGAAINKHYGEDLCAN